METAKGGGARLREMPHGQRSVAQGLWGEEVAARLLRKRGWRILERRARPCRTDRRCEIDIVAFDPRAERVVFVEVKTHASHSPFASRMWGVDCRKRRVLHRACSSWLRNLKWHGRFRFDVVEVYGSCDSATPPQADHLEGVKLFGPNWRFW